MSRSHEASGSPEKLKIRTQPQPREKLGIGRLVVLSSLMSYKAKFEDLVSAVDGASVEWNNDPALLYAKTPEVNRALMRKHSVAAKKLWMDMAHVWFGAVQPEDLAVGSRPLAPCPIPSHRDVFPVTLRVMDPRSPHSSTGLLVHSEVAELRDYLGFGLPDESFALDITLGTAKIPEREAPKIFLEASSSIRPGAGLILGPPDFILTN